MYKENIEDIIEEITLEELQDDDSLIEDVEEVPEDEDEDEDDDVIESNHEDEDEEETLDEDFMSAFTTVAGGAAGLAAILAAWGGIKVAAYVTAKTIKDVEIAAAKKAAAERLKKYEDYVESIATKFEDDAELKKMYADLPDYKKDPKARTKQLTSIGKYIKGKLDAKEQKVFTDISAVIRSKMTNSIEEAKMEDSEVLAAAKKLAANAKDDETKEFGQGLVDFYDENGSFTPKQVSGLQNIMKNAGFQLAKEATEPEGGIDELDDEDHIPTPEEVTKQNSKGEDATSKSSVPEADEIEDEDEVPTPEELFKDSEEAGNVVSKSKSNLTKESFQQMGLSEKFQAKAQALFEEKVQERVQEIEDALVEKVNSYLDYVVENWMKENELAVERGIRTEIAENFIEQLKSVFIENYIEVPENRIDLVESMEDEIQNLEKELDSSINENVELNETLSGLVKKYLINEASRNLTITQSSKLESLLEDVSIEDVDEFKSKIENVKESIIRENYEVEYENDTILEDYESMDEGAEINDKPKNKIDIYADAISKMVGRK
jgi:hypothetical protein